MDTRLKTALLSGLLAWANASAQDFTLFDAVYPIGKSPQISGQFIHDKPSSETILFEAEPILRLPIYNNIRSSYLDEKKFWSHAEFISYRPQLRMYTDWSKPVKMPSYRILPGTQHLWLRSSGNHRYQVIGFNFESGHYSNGQDGCAYGRTEDQDSLCKDVYAGIDDNSDLSRMLNRSRGEFSTNFTELSAMYQWGWTDDDDRQARIISLTPRATLFHDRFLGLLGFGGFSEADIEIYGRWRWGVNARFEDLAWGGRRRVELDGEFIQGAHESVNPFRGGLTLTYFLRSGVGGFLGLYTGHDDYNVRFVDDLPQQFKLGVTWDASPALQFHHAKVK